MNSETVLFDPEFEAILREVAADPRSSLLRVERPRVLPEIFDRSSPVSTYATGLTSAERHLLQVHRCEVGSLLREVCRIKLIEGPSTKQYVSRYSEPGKSVTLLTRAQVRDGVRDRMQNSADVEECAHGIDLLVQCVADLHGETPRVRELATAALRLEPTDSARLLAGYDLTLSAQRRSAFAVLHMVLSSNPTAPVAARAWECLASNYAALGHASLAHEAHKLGSCLGSVGALNWLSRTLYALQLGLRDDAERASRWLDDHVSPDDPAIEWFVVSLSAQRDAREWTPTSKGIQLAGSMGDQLGRIGRRIADVVA